MTKKFIVYLATNGRNGKRYVGASSRGLNARRRQHLYDVRAGNHRCRVFHDAIKKHGEESFNWSILCEVSSFDEMMREEIGFISILKPEYNMTEGGQGTLGFSSGPLSETHRAQVVAALVRGQAKIKKPVILIESGEIFASVDAVAKRYRLNEKMLYDRIHHGRSYRGFSFAMIDADGCPLRVKKRREIRKVLCLTDMVVSNSLITTAEKYGVNRATLTRRCTRGDERPIAGLQFCFLDQWCPNPE